MKRNDFAGRKVLITGGLGFIGSNLAHALVKRKADVTLIDSMIPDFGGNEANVEDIKHKVRISYTDMRSFALPYIIKNQDIIFNLAGQISHMDSMKDPVTDLEINAKSQLHLLESCRYHNPSVKIIYASTRQIYGKTKQKPPINEDHPIDPTDINGINKLSGELFHSLYHKVFGIKTVSLRLTNCYGPRQLIRHDRQGFIAWFINRTVLNKEIKLYGDGLQIRDFTYIDDVVDAFLRVAVESNADGQVYNLGGIRPYSLLEVAKILKRINPKLKISKIPFPRERKKIDIGNYIGDWSKIHKDIGWKPKIDLEMGLKKTLTYFRKNLSNYL